MNCTLFIFPFHQSAFLHAGVSQGVFVEVDPTSDLDVLLWRNAYLIQRKRSDCGTSWKADLMIVKA